MTYFFDNNISPKVVQILRILGVGGLHLQEKYPADTSDEDWLADAGKEEWIVVTGDDRIRRSPAQRKALEQAGVTAVFFYKGFLRLPMWDQVVWVLRCWRDVEKEARKARRGTTLHVAAGRKVEHVR